jgi:NAD(P)-dependent dehydrogenase (short-subunit alcohol dehydrogenase family)
VLSKEHEVVNRKIQVYSLCPGYVDTDMTSHKGVLTIQQGALTPIFLAELPFEVNDKYQGQFF